MMKVLKHSRLNPGRFGRGIVFVIGVCVFGMVQMNGVAADGRPRVIVTTDGEGDDQCSMVRFLLYANDFDVQGIVITSSKHHWKGDGATPGYKWLGTDWLDGQLNAYEQVYPQLKQHDPAYPSPDYLKSNVFIGNILLEGDLREATPGSEHIVRILLQPDSSPVWLQAWGGPNTIARALKTIQEKHPERMAEVSKKARIFMIAQQDQTYTGYIQKEWPGITTLWSDYNSYWGLSYRWYNFQTDVMLRYFESDWLMSNILEKHGPLTALYPLKKGKYRSEGDSPTFLHLINTGLRSHEDPAWGGWGGRFKPYEGMLWRSVDQEGVRPHSILRWIIDIQNDWAARADWCVKEFKEANHPPCVVLDHDSDLTAKPGQHLNLSAKATRDPDGDALDFQWWHYAAAGTYSNVQVIEKPTSTECSVAMPEDARPGDTLHFVCTVTDDGAPPLTRYARVVITVD